MLILIDKKIPDLAKENLRKWGEILELQSEGLVYDAISGHPDIFLFQYNNHLIISPQCPKYCIKFLENHAIKYHLGTSVLGLQYPQTAAYNVAAADGLFIGNSTTTDKNIIEISKEKLWIESPQAYSRCNTLILDKEHLITSEITVHNSHIDSLLINSKPILLEGFSNGFFGGCAGFYEHKLFLIGALSYHPQGDEIKRYCNKLNFEIIELYPGPFFDGGGVFFLKS